MKTTKKILLALGAAAAVGAAYKASELAKRYAPRKEKPRSHAPIIAALGDSITFGAGVAENRPADTWEYQLEQLFSGTWQVLNYGISGATLQDEGDMPYWHMKYPGLRGFPEAALSHFPEIVLLMLGSNDSKPYNWNRERYTQQLYSRVKQLQAAPGVKRVIMMCPPFATPAEGSAEVAFDIKNEVIRDEIVPIVKQCAADTGAECIDLYALTDGHPEYFADGVHPNAMGNMTIAQCIHDYICAG